MRPERFERIVSSDLVRAYDTARTIARGAPVERDPRWREFMFGKWEGLTWDEIAARWPQTRRHGLTGATQYAPPQGETFQLVRERVASALDDITNGPHQRVLVVTHAGPLHAVLHELFAQRTGELPETGIRFLPASITKVRFENGTPQIVALNETKHLP